MSEKPDDFEKWSDALTSFVEMTGGKIVCYDEEMKSVALDATEFVLKVLAAMKHYRATRPVVTMEDVRLIRGSLYLHDVRKDEIADLANRLEASISAVSEQEETGEECPVRGAQLMSRGMPPFWGVK